QVTEPRNVVLSPQKPIWVTVTSLPGPSKVTAAVISTEPLEGEPYATSSRPSAPPVSSLAVPEPPGSPVCRLNSITCDARPATARLSAVLVAAIMPPPKGMRMEHSSWIIACRRSRRDSGGRRKDFRAQRLLNRRDQVPSLGLEPRRPEAGGLESPVSTNSTKRASPGQVPGLPQATWPDFRSPSEISCV